MSDSGTNHHLRRDQPLGQRAGDRIGLGEVAGRVARAIVELETDVSLVIGLEGRWGSGKSSLLLMVEEELATLQAVRAHSVLHFRPWLVGNRDALLVSLFADLTATIAHIEADAGDATKVSLARARRAADAIRAFATALSRAGATIEVAGELSTITVVQWIGKGLKAVGEWFGHKSNPASLDQLRARLVTALGELDHRIIVTIDDVDRLEPAEIIEVLRLARSVADLPNLLYLLCYDGEILARGIEGAAGVADGHAFLEKIVQLTIPVPSPEIFQLRYWFEAELADFAIARGEEAAQRLKSVIDMEGGHHLKTPRAVVRTLDALRFLWPALAPLGIDLADLVWLQLIKNGRPRLYRWIEEYCATAAEASLGVVRVDDVLSASLLKDLLEIGGDGYFSDLHYRHHFADHLPGVSPSYSKDESHFALLQRVGSHEQVQAIAERRLASPDHYRLYFALANPSHALVQADFEGFWSASREGADAVVQVLVTLHLQSSPRALSKADLLFERLRGTNPDALDPPQCTNILTAFANSLDEAYRLRPFERHWKTDLWDRCERLLQLFLRRLDTDQRAATIDAMFAHGRALGWLSWRFRDELVSHGRYGDRQKPEDEWHFSAAELDRITAIMQARYRAMTWEEIRTAVFPRDILYGWLQSGDTKGLSACIGHLRDDDGRFLDLLEALQSTVTTTKASFKSLKAEYLKDFLDPAVARQRVTSLAGGPTSDITLRAQRLLEAYEVGDDY